MIARESVPAPLHKSLIPCFHMIAPASAVGIARGEVRVRLESLYDNKID